jgi:methylmalonyl-CoA/ethylmalonyl-CoA epimerase
MLKDLDHIGIAVKSIESVRKTLEDGLGLSPEFEEEVADQKVRVAGFKIGHSVIEYLEPLSPDSPISRFLEKRGNGVHHLAFRVSNLDKSLKTLKEKGYRLIDEKSRTGAEGKKIAFLHPSSFDGILIELCEY